jgi:hypothetical protein
MWRTRLRETTTTTTTTIMTTTTTEMISWGGVMMQRLGGEVRLVSGAGAIRRRNCRCFVNRCDRLRLGARITLMVVVVVTMAVLRILAALGGATATEKGVAEAVVVVVVVAAVAVGVVGGRSGRMGKGGQSANGTERDNGGSTRSKSGGTDGMTASAMAPLAGGSKALFLPR